jgi:hypothetical protein
MAPVYLTLTSTAPRASDLGYLLHKHPDRAQQFDISAGVAHVFYPEVNDQRCTVALLLEVDPIALVRGRRYGLAQPGLKVRGREYLRIIYGPDYTEPANLTRLRDRNLNHKRSLALREYALGLESLERLVQREPLWRVHEPVFPLLALESEPVDPRL